MGQIVFGGEAFAANIQERINQAKVIDEIPRSQRFPGRPLLETIFAEQENQTISNNPDEFARLVLCLYTDKDIWNKQVKEGVACLNTHFSRERVKEIWSQDIELS